MTNTLACFLFVSKKGKKFVDFNFTKLCFSSLTAIVTRWHVSFKFFQALLLYLKERPEPICLEDMYDLHSVVRVLPGLTQIYLRVRKKLLVTNTRLLCRRVSDKENIYNNIDTGVSLLKTFVSLSLTPRLGKPKCLYPRSLA